MAEIVDFGLQKHKLKMDSRYFDNTLSVVAGDTGRRIEVQLLDTNGMVQNTTGLNLRLNADVEGKVTFTDATLVDAATGKYQLDLSNGMFLAPGNWQFQWQITDSAGKKLHSFAFTGNVGKNISEGGSQATNFYLNLDDLKAMQEELVNGTFDSEVLETKISEKLTNLESEYAPKLTEVTAQLAETGVNVKQFGALGDGITDDSTAIQTAIDYCVDNQKPLYFPEGVFIIGDETNILTPVLKDGDSFHMFGAGTGKTIIRERGGLTAELGRFNRMFYINVTGSATVESVKIHDLTLDKNGRESQLPEELGAYAWEQAHLISLVTATGSYIKNTHFKNIEVLDIIGGGIVFASGLFGNVEVENLRGGEYHFNGGSRADFEFQASIENLNIKNSSGRFIQSEPNVSATVGGGTMKATLENCSFDSMDFVGYSTHPENQQITLINSHSERNNFGYVYIRADKSTITTGKSVTFRWAGIAEGSTFTDCTINIRYVEDTQTLSPLYLDARSVMKVDFNNCVIQPTENAPDNVDGYAIASQARYNGVDPFHVAFNNCYFSPKFNNLIYAYANGHYTFKNSALAGNELFARVGSYLTYHSSLVVDNCDLSNVKNNFINLNYNNDLFKVLVKGSYDYDKLKIVRGSGSEPERIENNVIFEGIIYSDGIPNDFGVKNMVVTKKKITQGEPYKYVCTETDISLSGVADFKMIEQAGVGTGATANRPTLTNADIGVSYFDTTINKPILWNGEEWKDYTGETV